MPSINLLDQGTVSKIAAGEVVERPLSVVKELVENCLDARATEISIHLEEGGHDLIRVSDNGCGMSRQDAEICLKSHSTSKLGCAEDLENVLTLGFRGEALNSIGAVARLTLTTSDGSGDVGWTVRMEGGVEFPAEPAARVRGTTVEVENLFFNVPARRKFLKSPRSEITSVNSLITNFLLGHPRVGFDLVHGGKTVMKVPPGQDHADRIEFVMGKNISDEVVHVTGSLMRIGLNAYFTLPDLTFPNRKYQVFFVNGRAVRDRNITVAVDAAYRGLVGGGRYGMAVLFIDMPAGMVDVNVHPTKSEVRFENPHEIHSLVYKTIHGRFVRQEDEGAPGVFRLVTTPQPAAVSGSAKDSEILLRRPPLQTEVDFKPETPVNGPQSGGTPVSDGPELDDDAPFGDRTSPAPPPKPDRGVYEDLENEKLSASRFSILGQFFDTFIMAQVDGAPVFVDQHVACERIIYNQLKRKSLERHSQMLLISQPVEVPRDVYDVLAENLEKVKKAGLEIEPFGDRAFVIRSVVHNAGPFDPSELLLSVAEELRSARFKAPEDVLLDRLLTVAACKMSVKAGQKLTHEEMHDLVERLLKQEYNRTCPHGRPIFHSITRETLNSWFKR